MFGKHEAAARSTDYLSKRLSSGFFGLLCKGLPGGLKCVLSHLAFVDFAKVDPEKPRSRRGGQVPPPARCIC